MWWYSSNAWPNWPYWMLRLLSYRDRSKYVCPITRNVHCRDRRLTNSTWKFDGARRHYQEYCPSLEMRCSPYVNIWSLVQTFSVIFLDLLRWVNVHYLSMWSARSDLWINTVKVAICQKLYGHKNIDWTFSPGHPRGSSQSRMPIMTFYSNLYWLNWKDQLKLYRSKKFKEWRVFGSWLSLNFGVWSWDFSLS